MEGVLLGSGGWIPTSRRETCCALLRTERHILLIDAGTGVHRLLERPELLAGVEHVDIVLTHFHLDHIVGLAYLPALRLVERVTLWGPGDLLADAPTKSILERLLGPPFFSAPLSAIVGEVREVRAGALELDHFTIETRIQERHTEPTLALRIGNAVTYCTDTARDHGNVEFAAGSHVLLHEAWHATDTSDDPAHTAAGDAARIARDAGVEHLVLIHVNPVEDSTDELAQCARAEFPNTEVGTDLARIPLP
jgi:ribonuclease BN (tRNA processing enzyme)